MKFLLLLLLAAPLRAATSPVWACVTSTNKVRAFIGTDFIWHLRANTSPSVSCTSGSPSVSGSDARFTALTGKAGATCTITFGHTWTNAPICNCRDESATAVTVVGVPGAATFTMHGAGGGFGAADSVTCMCDPR